VLLAVLDDLGEDLGVDVGDRDAVVGAAVLDHVQDGPRLPRHRLLHLEVLLVAADQHQHLVLPRRCVRRHRSDRRGGKGVEVVVGWCGEEATRQNPSGGSDGVEIEGDGDGLQLHAGVAEGRRGAYGICSWAGMFCLGLRGFELWAFEVVECCVGLRVRRGRTEGHCLTLKNDTRVMIAAKNANKIEVIISAKFDNKHTYNMV
jgi:hypothetical protein